MGWGWGFTPDETTDTDRDTSIPEAGIGWVDIPHEQITGADLNELLSYIGKVGLFLQEQINTLFEDYAFTWEEVTDHIQSAVDYLQSNIDTSLTESKAYTDEMETKLQVQIDNNLTDTIDLILTVEDDLYDYIDNDILYLIESNGMAIGTLRVDMDEQFTQMTKLLWLVEFNLHQYITDETYKIAMALEEFEELTETDEWIGNLLITGLRIGN